MLKDMDFCHLRENIKNNYVLSLNKFSTQRLIVSYKGMLVKSYFMSKLAITSLESKLWSSSSIWTKNFTNLYVGILITDKIGLKYGRPSVIICRKTLSVSYLLRPCLNHWSYLIKNSINSMMELQWVSH